MRQIKLPASTGCTQNVKNALDDALGIDKPFFFPVIFSICLKNYQRFTGFRLMNGNYSAYPNERETLLMEETSVFVLGVEEQQIQNGNIGFEHLHD